MHPAIQALLVNNVPDPDSGTKSFEKADTRSVRIGPDPAVAGFFWVAALGGHGMSTSYGVGRLASEAIVGEPSTELARFAPSRLTR